MIPILPIEVIDHIVDFISVRSIIPSYKAGLLPFSKDDLHDILSDKLNFDIKDYTLDGIEVLTTTDYLVFLLSTLGKT